jgi:CRISPR type IV-associated protein Csf1
MQNQTTLPATPVQHFDSRPLTAPQLFARYQPQGDETCFYCGGQCDQTHAAKDVVKSSFTGLDTVTLSNWVCVCCVDAMQEGIDLTLIDGHQKSNQKIRGYSWIITSKTRQACTKAHRVDLLDVCIDPPATPFVICISDSGQKHLLYRAVVNHSRELITVTLEGESITYQPSQLIERLQLCKQIAAATGKPAMKETMSTQTQMRIIEHYESEHVLAAWNKVRSEPLTRLAVWLCPAKEECLVDYPKWNL